MEKLIEEQEDPKKNPLALKDFISITNAIVPGGIEKLVEEAVKDLNIENTRVKPLAPKDVIDGLGDIIPGFIIEAVNNLLKKQFRSGSCKIKQKDIAKEAIRVAAQEGKKVTSSEIYDNNWMDFESIFRKAGWKVSYDKPGWDEDYDAVFEFSTK